jgi:hypothetical protein
MSAVWKDSHGRIYVIGYATEGTYAKALNIPMMAGQVAVQISKGDLKDFIVGMMADKFCEDERDYDE